jgi:NADH-quinone oxidoreductase subunit J
MPIGGAQISFFVLAIVAVGSALGVLLFRNAVYCMLSLIVNLLSLALFFLMLDAMFVATIQVLIYAGAVMILFLFVVTMLSPDLSDVSEPDRLRWQWIAGAGFGVILAGALITALVNGSISQDARVAGMNGLAQVAAEVGNTQAFGLALFHGFSFPFEVTSVLLIVAILGAVVLGRRLMSR